MPNIHKTAIVSKKAKIADDVQIAPYAVIGDNVTLGKGVKIGSHCVLDGYTSIGNDCQIFSLAVIGSQPQDLKFKGEKSFLQIGSGNIIREFCTFNPGTGEGSKTIIGNNNLFMAYSHVAHDCQVGNSNIFANNATLAGHVRVEDKVVIGGLAAIHQFVRVGMLSIIGGCSKVVKDIPPYSMCDGHPAMVYGLNLVGLRRSGINRDTIKELKSAYKIIFHSGLSLKHALEEMAQKIPALPEITYFVNFARNSERGLSRSCLKDNENDRAYCR